MKKYSPQVLALLPDLNVDSDDSSEEYIKEFQDNSMGLDNRVIEAKYYLDIHEQRFIDIAITKIKKEDVIDANTWFEVTPDDYSQIYWDERYESWRILQKVANSIFEREITIFEDKITKLKKHRIRWVSEIFIDKENHVIKFQFSQRFIPYIYQLKGDFTVLNIRRTAAIQAPYTYRFHNILMAYNWKKVVNNARLLRYDKEYLMDILDVDGSYRIYANFKNKVLIPVMRDLNRKFLFKVRLYEIYSSKAVDMLLFEFVAYIDRELGMETVWPVTWEAGEIIQIREKDKINYPEYYWKRK